MSRYTRPKARVCRRLGMNLFGSNKYDKILAKRPYAPGVQGQNTRSKKTEYAKQLAEKQKARFMFGITERQCQRYYGEADRSHAVTHEEFLRLLERRLDNVLYRSGFALTRPQARQMVSHGLFMLNGRRVTIPSIQVKPNDKITIRTRSSGSQLFSTVKEGKEKIKPPSWLNADPKNLAIEVLALPEAHELEQGVLAHLIVEFYSK